jgi:hypothetical protein
MPAAVRKTYGLWNQERETLSGRSAAVEMLPRFFHASNAPNPTTSINSLTSIPRVIWPTTIIQTNTKQDETPNPNPTERQHSARVNSFETLPHGNY